MTSLSQVWHWLWFTHTGLHGLLFGLLVWRRFYKDFPIFFAYTGFASLQTAVVLVMNYAPAVSGQQYYVVYVASTTVLTALSFGVVYELLTHLLRDYPALRSLGTRFFRWAAIILVGIALVLAWFAPAGGGDHLMSVVFLLTRTVDLLLCGLLVLLFVFPRYFHLSWQNYACGIALGLGVLASADLAAFAIRSQIEPVTRNLSEDMLDVVTQGATLCSVLIWTAYVVRPQRRSHAQVSSLPFHDLETWNQELERLLHQ